MMAEIKTMTASIVTQTILKLCRRQQQQQIGIERNRLSAPNLYNFRFCLRAETKKRNLFISVRCWNAKENAMRHTQLITISIFKYIYEYVKFMHACACGGVYVRAVFFIPFHSIQIPAEVEQKRLSAKMVIGWRAHIIWYVYVFWTHSALNALHGRQSVRQINGICWCSLCDVFILYIGQHIFYADNEHI